MQLSYWIPRWLLRIQYIPYRYHGEWEIQDKRDIFSQKSFRLEHKKQFSKYAVKSCALQNHTHSFREKTLNALRHDCSRRTISDHSSTSYSGQCCTRDQLQHYTIKDITAEHGKLLFSGIPFGYLDRSSHISIWNVINIMRDAFNCVYNQGYMDHARLMENNTLFSVKVHYMATDEFYTKAALFNPVAFECTTALKSIGQSSIIDSITLTEETSGILFAKSLCKWVYFCNQNKKPVPLPDWFAEKYTKPNSDEATLLLGKTPPLSVPQQMFSHKLQTRYTDIDSNGHVATEEYFRFCMECAMEASRAGFYRQFVSEFWLFPVLEADMTLLSPIIERTELNILTWQCEYNAAKMYFVVMERNSRKFEGSFLFSENKLKPVPNKL